MHFDHYNVQFTDVHISILRTKASVCACHQQNPVYGANVVIFEGIMAFVYPEVRDVSLLVIVYCNVFCHCINSVTA